MNSHIVKLSALGLAGALTLSSGSIVASAKQTVLTETNSLAGVTVSLDDDLSKTTGEETQDTSEESNSMVKASGDAALDSVNAVVAEDVVLNIKYDRLGIAHVDGALNVRKKASTDSKVVGKMSNGAACNVEKVTKDGWAKIKSGDVRGYVSLDYLVLDEEAEVMALEVGKKVATVETTTLNARFLPSTESGKYTLVPAGEELEVVRDNISKKYVDGFIDKHFSDKKSKKLISDVDTDSMQEELPDWLCVSIDDEKVFVAREFVSVSYELDRAVSTKKIADSSSESKNGSEESASGRSAMVSYAMQFLGNPYVYGGTSLTNGTDCSGFTMRIYEHFGYGIPRTSSAQASYARTISSSEAQPGDLFFYGYNGSVSHVAMYIGGGQVIHASNERTGIKISNAFYRTPIKVGRVIN